MGKLDEDQKRNLLIGGSVLALGLGCAAAYYWYSMDSPSGDSTAIDTQTATPAKTVSPVKRMFSLFAGDNFPLKEKSSGDRVKQLQQALKRYNPKINADGKFGTETTDTLKAAKLPTVIDEKTFNAIVNPPKPLVKKYDGEFDPKKLGRMLHDAVDKKDIEGVISVLRTMNNSSDYQLVNQQYEQAWWMPGTSYSIVTDLLQNAFPAIKDPSHPKNEEERKQQANRERVVNEFRRLLVWNKQTKQFNLQGFGLSKELITINQTLVWDGNGNRIKVNPNVILGSEMYQSNGKTFFKGTDKKMYAVLSKDVKYT